MWEYTDKVKEHFLNPRNVGEIENADAVGEVGSLACGDALKLYLKVDENERIVDARFQTFGCASAIASSSALTELIKGKTVDEALAVTNKDIAAYLGGLPKEKMHCSVMGQEALEAAVKNLRGVKIETVEPEGELVCECFGVYDGQIRRTVRENSLKTAEEVTYFTKAGGGCGKCVERIEEIIAEEQGRIPPVPKEKPRKLTNIQRITMINKILDEEIRPLLQADGGDVELVDVDRTIVSVTLRGRCTNCPSSQATLTQVVEKMLRDKVDPEITVEEV